tara:strand:+ start:470 stop:865 length:396 start_codon:yes stop_codon:yes gene_type:complete
MKILITFFVLFFSSLVFADVYYCIEEKVIGFDNSDNMKISSFKPKKFIVDIDFELNKIITDEEDDGFYLGFSYYISSECLISEDRIYCINDLGSSFVFNRNTKKFNFSNLYMHNNVTTDDIWMSYGKCSRF